MGVTIEVGTDEGGASQVGNHEGIVNSIPSWYNIKMNNEIVSDKRF